MVLPLLLSWEDSHLKEIRSHSFMEIDDGLGLRVSQCAAALLNDQVAAFVNGLSHRSNRQRHLLVLERDDMRSLIDGARGFELPINGKSASICALGALSSWACRPRQVFEPGKVLGNIDAVESGACVSHDPGLAVGKLFDIRRA